MSVRPLILVGIVLVSTTLVLSTGAVSSGALDREAAVGIADDESGALRVAVSDVDVYGTTTGVEILTVRNQFTTDFTTVSVSVQEADDSTAPSLSNVADVGSLTSGQSASVTADIACGASASSETVSLTIFAVGDRVEVSLERQFVVSCTAPA